MLVLRDLLTPLYHVKALVLGELTTYLLENRRNFTQVPTKQLEGIIRIPVPRLFTGRRRRSRHARESCDALIRMCSNYKHPLLSVIIGRKCLLIRVLARVHL